MGSPDDRRYLQTHEWARLGEGEVWVGISAFAVEALQDLVFIDLPGEGDRVTAGAPFGEIESVKAVSDLIAPISGEVAATNRALEDDLELLKRDPYHDGLMVRIKPDGDAAAVLAGLLDAAAYDARCAAGDEH